MDLKVELPFGGPPILPDVEKQLKEYLLSPEKLPIHHYETSQQHWEQLPNPSALYHCELSPVGTTLMVERDLITGELKGFKEVFLDGTALPSKIPKNKKSIDDIFKILEDVGDVLENEEILETPPWFSRGFDFSKNSTLDVNETASGEKKPNESSVINLPDLIKEDKHLFDFPVDPSGEETDEKSSETKTEDVDSTKSIEDSDIINNIPQEVKFSALVIKISEAAPLKGVTSTEWAQVIDVSQPVTDFHQRIPDMAFKYKFELDTFQKQAILKLEEHCNVLVAAHTSAGKTVVAEYAIALSQRHMTRAIYTSPIKALSNQKYRDFRNTFKDVGLITGDFQINQTGTCLIMTTEILRSMLLAQAEIIRDLEYVIFDEVHYINDFDRGHVWEEVVILLPQHVSIVMLSATVPNTLQFADWVGRTKQRKMFVISTTQRPVPLEHYLYTGSGGSSKDERFLILSANNEFQRKGYLEAVEAKKKRESKTKEGPKNKNFTQLVKKAEITMWVALLDHLQKHDKLPVVAFTLSKKRCDENAKSLMSADLTTAREKFHIRRFFQQSIQRLKEPDQQLPQILQMQRLLENGIGVHHSGILPILKEIVEMLFQERCVKILFATETFAMGVNMPAKTVVFDSIKKYDGLEPRILLPSEYIQMAGRAGRRGLDKTGTVIIICKGDVPSEADLIYLMKGLPRKIESQFRLTYSIILKLERKRIAAEGRVTVEEMMANSFKEADHLKKKKSHAQTLAQVEKDLSEMEDAVLKSSDWGKLCEMCFYCLEYLEKWKDLSPKIFTDKVGLKNIVIGRVVLITHKAHINKLGIILSCEYKKDVKFKALVLTNEADDKVVEDTKESEGMCEEWYKVLGLLKNEELFVPESLGPHMVLAIDPWDIIEVTSLTTKVDAKIVLSDWNNRQIPRFRDSPPGQTFQRALEGLMEITRSSAKSDPKLEYLNLLKDMKITSEEDYRKINDLLKLKSKVASFSPQDIFDWEKQLKNVFKFKYLERKKENLKYLLSYQSMSLYTDYRNRLEVLRKLNYVDNKYSVQMKGNVACEMSNHELLITELVLRNALNDLQPAEIAALLSCFVYEGKKQNEDLQLTSTLKTGINTIKKVAKEVFMAEKECGVGQSEASGNEENLNFDLVPVVYEWAREKVSEAEAVEGISKSVCEVSQSIPVLDSLPRNNCVLFASSSSPQPFSQIMTLTTIQEGIIVRCIQQLNETIRDVKNAARIIGEPTLQQKMEDASNAIKRDIVFAASLYMQ